MGEGTGQKEGKIMREEGWKKGGKEVREKRSKKRERDR